MSPDSDLEALRSSIDRIDRSILELVAERVRVVLAVGEHKRRVGAPVYDADRERELLDDLAGRASAPLDGETVRRIFERLIDESRRLEQHYVSSHEAGDELPPRPPNPA